MFDLQFISYTMF